MKIGIITMHRVLNFGSALQAYALQQALLKLGYDNEIIDYVFPHETDVPLLMRANLFLRKKIYEMRTGAFFVKKKEGYFKAFRKQFLALSDKTYTRESILSDPPAYDLYMTGSDQVWNPLWMKDDINFLLSFVRNKKKISYASSFAVDAIPEESKPIYRKYLQEYKHITVRENSGEKIVKELLDGRETPVVCDPTLLLDQEDYIKIAKKPRLDIHGPYLLVYILDYMFNPFPEVNNIVRNVAETLGLPVVYIGGKYTVYDSHCLSIEHIGPCEFIWLFQHAKFVITTSFHGTAFATVFEKPLLAVVKTDNDKDGRVTTLMKNVGNEKAITSFTSHINYDRRKLYQFKANTLKYKKHRVMSLRQLDVMVEQVTN